MSFRKAARGAEVTRELLPGQSRALLQALHLLDARGNLQADTRRKLKQVNHLVRLLTPALEDAFARHEEPVVVDAGAGNAYLGFVLYELFLGPLGHDRGALWCVEARADLAARVRERAADLGYARLHTLEARLDDVRRAGDSPVGAAPLGAALPPRIHALVALHACDTATDDALALAIERGVDHVAVVPCCQAEVATQLKELGDAVPDPALRALWRRAWHRRELGSHLTNVVRALALEAHGYQVTVTELTGWEHAVKNELILARRVGRASARARRELDDLLARIPVRPALLRALAEDGAEEETP